MYVYHVNFRPYGPISFLSYYRHFYLGHGPRPLSWVGPVGPTRTSAISGSSSTCSSSPSVTGLAADAFSGKKRTKEGRPPKSVEIIAFAVLLAAVTFVVRLWYPIDRWIGFLGFIQVAFADVPRDLAFFVIGIVAYRRNWFSAMPKKTGEAWLVVGIAAVALCYGLFAAGHGYFKGGGPGAAAFVYDLWEAFLCCGLCIGPRSSSGRS